jgi:hypothetical protein
MAAGAVWRPYSPDYIFNRPLRNWSPTSTGDPPLHVSSATMVANIVAQGLPSNPLPAAGFESSASWPDYASPIYVADPADPLFTVQRVLGATPGFTGDNYGTQIRIPQNALPANGSDGHMTVIHGGFSWSFYNLCRDEAGTLLFTPANRLPSGGGTIYCRGFQKTSLTGSGQPIWTSILAGSKATAAGPDLLTGRIEPQHLLKGRIPYALRLAIKSCATTYAAAGYVYPALGQASQTISGMPPNGARLQLNMTLAQIAALSIPRSDKIVLRALSEFGAIVCDTTGAAMAFPLSSGTPGYALRGVNDWKSYADNVGLAEGWTYAGTPDFVYVWGSLKNAADWGNASTGWRVLDWTHADNI